MKQRGCRRAHSPHPIQVRVAGNETVYPNGLGGGLQMGKLKRWIENLSLRTSFVLYVAVFLFIGVAVSAVVINASDNAINRIYASYQDTGNRYYLITEDGERIDNQSVVFLIPPTLSNDNKRIISALEAVSIVTIPVVFIIGIVLVAFLFYKSKLKRPLALLDAASARIGQNDLDFKLIYEPQDEMGMLCQSFEKMREVLQANNLEMWRQMDERRQLNAAFSHDLRTPLTVLKGQSEMLLKYVPEGKMPITKIVETVDTMKSHIVRLEKYAEAMTKLQKLEDIEIRKADVFVEELTARLKVSGIILCGNKKLQFDTTTLHAEMLCLDLSAVMQVYENLLANAVRYANDTVLVSLSDEGSFSIAVADDGPGFSEKDLTEAARPFHQANKNADDQHLGIGLSICKTLCEKHGGYIKLFNHQIGATVKAVF